MKIKVKQHGQSVINIAKKDTTIETVLDSFKVNFEGHSEKQILNNMKHL